MIEEAEWARRLLTGSPEPYYKRSGLVPIATIAGTDNPELMQQLNDAIASMDQQGSLPTTRELLPQLFKNDPQQPLRFRQS